MGADTGLHANQAGREVGKPGFELAARELLAQNDGAALVEADEVEDVLADVDAENGDGVFRVARHGPGSLLGSAPRSTLGYCREHRRSIPLAVIGRSPETSKKRTYGLLMIASAARLVTFPAQFSPDGDPMKCSNCRHENRPGAKF